MKTSPTDLAFLHGGNMAYLESLYRDGGSGNGAWREVFSALDNGGGIPAAAKSPGKTAGAAKPSIHKQAQVSRLISAYRALGHLSAEIDPIGVMPRDSAPLDLAEFELGEADLDTEFDLGTLGRGGRKPLRDLIAYLRAVYCGPIGYEVSHLTSNEQRHWLFERAESEPVRPALAAEEQLELLQKLTAAEGLEKYLHTKYAGQKRFSLEGGDVLIPVLADMVRQSGAAGVREMVVGMAHRGRLNVLVNILGKAPKDLFSEFEGEYDLDAGENQTGDVKYHQGASSDIETPGGVVHLALSFNPSHLEIIDPVVEGSVRARQERRRDAARKQVVPVLIHGDAAFAGQGVVMETLNMARTRGYSVGGTIHIIINNQIGFTTNTLDARSTLYCTEVAKMVQAPIFHVNGDDPEAARQAARLALEYRMKFGGDAILDIVCYRRHGHNEADEPSITQPIMYGRIRKHQTPREIYAARLAAGGALDEKRAANMVDDYRAQLDAGRVVAGQVIDPNTAKNMVDWKPYLTADWDDGTVTSVDAKLPPLFAKKLRETPKDFTVHPRVKKVLDERVEMASGKKPLDWGCAELLAYAAILHDGYDIRLSGQDAGRGTFSHRHVTLHDQSQARTHIPMQHLGAKSRYLVIDSLLSEEAVLGFEYGYATTEPRALVIWEAQFGDFVNGAQVVIDQFISSGQAKWARVCGLTMFLPHGLEGQGPEHSSARLERFLQLSAEQNMQVCAPTTPAQMFHMLRRQILRPLRRPLVVMTPKSLLRHKLAVSPVEELSGGKFHIVLGETEKLDPKKVTRLILCSGKVYYDLLEERRRRKITDAAIVRLEQLHPFPKLDLAKEMKRYPAVADIVWCQEEPKNQGAWYQIDHFLRASAGAKQSVRYVGREASPSPAVGYHKLHLEQQRRLVEQAFELQRGAKNAD
ncbi:MAG: subunit of E1(0) component of 2-oxoglutarate dehydrogenase [Arenicellales bacterium IbO2]|nr:2-oxoglutarate dehydrogenase E1 component [Gammaproteobacteria bacterium]CAJ2376946.1 MAG: subunit of E1(0) component of 2-oxoglutarate dehydrogenase [Arenicellales bacterium IbO2]